MRTVGEVAALANVTVRTLHHYDEIGLVTPSARSAAGYRLYAREDLERLQSVLFYRELGFGLDDIRTVLGDDGFDRLQALRAQRALLDDESRRLRRMVRAIDDAITALEEGVPMNDEAMFAVFGEQQRAIQAEAEERWGGTDPYRQTRKRTAVYTQQDWEELKLESEAIMTAIAEVYRGGAAADSEAAMDAVEAHRVQISERFYDCPHEMQVQLGAMYVQDPRFRATYEDLADGLAVWVRDAIVANAARAGR